MPKMANSTVGYIALLRQLVSFERLGRYQHYLRDFVVVIMPPQDQVYLLHVFRQPHVVGGAHVRQGYYVVTALGEFIN